MLSLEFARSVLPGGPGRWEVSGPLGSMGTTRIARRDGRALVVKLIDVPEIVVRLAELGVTPPVVEIGGEYLLQEYLEGAHPDHTWYAEHLQQWTRVLERYLYDPVLAELVAAAPGREHLTIEKASRWCGEPRSDWPEACIRSFERWQDQAHSLTAYAVRPIHTDAHMKNYVLADGRLYLLDWDQIDLSDLVRDVGVQAWGLLPRRLWADFVRPLGLQPDPELDAAICWWSAFKMLRTALWVEDGTFHAMLFERAVDQLDWVR